MSDDQTRLILAAIAEQGARIESVRSELAAANVAIARLQVQVESARCPDPGACNRMAPRLERLEQRVDPLEKIVEQLKGARLTLAAVVTVAGILGGTVGAKVVQFFTR